MAISDVIKKYFEPQEQVRLRDVLNPSNLASGVAKTRKGIVSGLQTTGQSAMRAYAGLGGAVTGKTLTPSTYFQRELYGTDKPITLGSVGAELGLSEKGKFAAPVGFALGVADLIPGGNLSKQGAVNLLKNASKADDALKILKSVLGVADDVARRYVDDAVRLTDTKQLTSLVDNVVNESQQVSRFVQKFVQKGKQALGLSDPLISEARKYKSAEEFVRAKGQPLLHFTDEANLGSIEKSGLRATKASEGEITDGISLATRRTEANEIFGEATARVYLDPKAKTITLKEALEKMGYGKETDLGVIKNVETEAPAWARKNGYDVLDMREARGAIYRGMDEIRVLNPDVVQTKSQLTDIWEMANKTPVTRERGFIGSAKEVLPEANKIAGQYIPRATDALAIKAKNLIKTDFAQAERIAMTGSDENAVAIASELLKKYADDITRTTSASTRAALNDKAAQIANTIAPKLTEQGRAIQAASILGRLTPEGQVRFAAREIQRYNETARVKIPELTGEQTGEILKEMREINNMVNGEEKAMRFKKLQEYIQDLVPTPIMNKIITVWKAGLLTGIKTQGLNIFSNLFHGVTEVAKDVPASIVDSVASLFTGQRTKAFTTKGLGKGISEGFEKGARYFKTGFDERDVAVKLDYKRVNFGKGIVAKAFQTYTDTVFRSLGASDQPFYYGALSRSLADQALAQGKNLGLKGKGLTDFAYKILESPSETMIRYAVADATTAVFQNKTKLGDAARKIQNIPGVGEIVLPFGRTPSAVAMQILNYSPVGIAKTIIENIGKGKFDQRLFSQGIGRGITGTAAIAIGVELFRNNMLTLDYPIGKEREQELQKAEGTKNNAVLIDGKWRSPIILGPFGNLILIGGHIQNALDTSGSPTEALSSAIFGGLKSFTEQTFLTGIQNAVNAITDPERYAKTYLPNLIASFVPTLASDISRATDPLERRTQGTLERIQARTPLRRYLEPQVDILGREIERIGNPLEVLADPTRPVPVKGNLVTGELRRLMDGGFNVSPTMLGDRAGYKALTPEQNTKLWTIAGSILNDKLNNLFNSKQYANLPEDQKAKVVERFVSTAQVNARVAMALELTTDMQGEELKNKLSELKAGGLLNREVFDTYMEVR